MVNKLCIGLVFVVITGTLSSIAVIKAQSAELKSLRNDLDYAKAQLKVYQHAKQIDNDVGAASNGAVTDWMREYGYITD